MVHQGLYSADISFARSNFPEQTQNVYGGCHTVDDVNGRQCHQVLQMESPAVSSYTEKTAGVAV
jgi:hypothetical protein